MSEEALQGLLERINEDETFRKRMLDDPEAAVADVDLSEVELLALACTDEDALRRLSGAETAAFGHGRLAFGISDMCALRGPARRGPDTVGCVNSVANAGVVGPDGSAPALPSSCFAT